MPKIKRHPMGWTTVYADSNTATFHPATPWMPASDIEGVRCTFEVAGIRPGTEGLQVRAGYQTADVENSPDSATGFGALTTADTNEVKYPAAFVDISSSTSAKQLIRFGWMVLRDNTTSTFTLARAAGVLELIDIQ